MRRTVKYIQQQKLFVEIIIMHLFTYENDYFQFVQGLMPQQVWEAKLVALEFIYNQCDTRDLMNYRKNWLPAGFVEIINTLNDKC